MLPRAAVAAVEQRFSGSHACDGGGRFLPFAGNDCDHPPDGSRGIAMRDLEDKSFLLLVIAVTIAFVWILWPFSGAILWGTVLAIVFLPLYRRILRGTRQRPN